MGEEGRDIQRGEGRERVGERGKKKEREKRGRRRERERDRCIMNSER